jgi:hypothetical protein
MSSSKAGERRPGFVPIPNPAVACRPSDDGWLVLVNLDTARSVALNPTAASIWRLVDGRRHPSHIVGALSTAWDDVPADAVAHVGEVLATLEEGGFVGREVAVYERRRGRESIEGRTPRHVSSSGGPRRDPGEE